MKKKKSFASELLNRSSASRLSQILIVAVSIVLALIFGALTLKLQGHDPVEIYRYLFVVPMSSGKGILKILSKLTPLLLAGLACSIAFKGNIWNIGVEGQLYAGALAAAAVGVLVTGLPRIPHVLLCCLAAMAVSAFLAWIPAVLKTKLNVHEVLTTVMLNHIISAVISLIVVNYFRYDGPTCRTPNVAETARLIMFKKPQQFNTMIIWAVIIMIALQIIFKRTPLGWRIEASGKNLEATRYSGVNSNKLVIVSMLISGAIAGLVGAERVCGGFGYMELNFSPGYGWDGFTIAVIANNNPIGVLFVSILMAILSYGGTSISANTVVPTEWVNILSAMIFVFVVAGNALLLKLPEWKTKRRLKKEGIIE